MRQYPRFVNPAEILIETVGREELRSLWMSDISKGGLFVQTSDPPPLRSRVRVSLSTPEGTLPLEAEVVHILTVAEAEAYGQEAGVGLQFVELLDQQREAIERYVDGISASIAAATPAQTEDLDRQALLADAQTFLSFFENDELYAALDVSPLAYTAEVADRVKGLLSRFAISNRGFSPAQAARMVHAKTILKKVAVLMLDEHRRLEHDFRHGLVFAEERLALGPTPEELQFMRATWHETFDGNWNEACTWAGEALKKESTLDYAGAIEAAQTALGLDPFNLELRTAIRNWNERLLARQRAQAGRASASTPAADHS